jgi:Domain of unknown function (DUF4190)
MSEDYDDRDGPKRRPRRAVDDDADEYEEDDRPRSRKSRAPDDGGMSTLIPYKNPKALLAYYLGVFGLIPILGFFLAIAAIVLGMMGLRYAKEYPTAKGTAHAITGIVLGTISVLYHISCIAFGAIAALMSAHK